MTPIYVFDPTARDNLSKVRGIGRYLQLLKEHFKDQFIFTDSLAQIPYDSSFINPFFDFLKTPLLMKRIAQKQIAIIHDLIPLKHPNHFPPGIKGQINIFLNKLSLKNYDNIITDSEASKKDIIQILHVNENKVKVIYPVISQLFMSTDSTDRSRPVPTTMNYELPTINYFLYVGDATWNKNLVNLTKAIQIANVTCVFVGKVFTQAMGGAREGLPAARNDILGESTAGKDSERQDPSQLNNPWQRELKEFLQLTKDDKRFIFPGFITDEELINLYKNATANILVSHDEGFGYSYFEASSQSTPSILSNIPVFHETAADTALFVNPNDPQDIADAINKFKEDRSLRQTYAQKANHRLQTFSPETFKNNFINCVHYSTPGVE